MRSWLPKHVVKARICQNKCYAVTDVCWYSIIEEQHNCTIQVAQEVHKSMGHSKGTKKRLLNRLSGSSIALVPKCIQHILYTRVHKKSQSNKNCYVYELKPSIEVSDKKGYIVTTLQIQQNLD